MKYLAWAIIPLVVSLLYYFAMKKSLASHVANMTKEQFIIRPPRMYIAVSAITSLIFVAFFVYCIVVHEILVAILCFGIFCLPMLGVLWYSIVWKIEVDKSQGILLFRNMFLQTYQIPFDQLLSYEERTQHYVIYTASKKIEVDLYAPNVLLFLAIIQKQNTPKKEKKKRH